MATSCDTVQNLFRGDGVTTLFSFTFEYDETKPEEVNVSLFDTTTKYYVPLDRSLWSFDGPTVVRLDTAPPAVTDKEGNSIANVKVWRRTDIDSLIASFYPGSAIRAQDLNANFEQLRQAILEGRCIVPTPIYEYIQDNFWDKYGDTIDSTEAWISDDEHVATTGAINNITTEIYDEINDINNDISDINIDISKIEGDITDINGSISEINDDIQDIVVNDLPTKWTKVSETINTGETWVSDDNNVATTGAIQKHILSILDDPQVPTKGYWNKDGDTVDSTDSWSPSDSTIATTKAIDNQLKPIKADVSTNANNIAKNTSDIQSNDIDIANRWDKSGDTLRSGWISSDSLIATTKAITDTFSAVTTGVIPPNDPQDGDIWLNSNTGCLYFYYTDADSSQWISVSTGPEGPVGPEGKPGDNATVAVGNTYTGPPGSSAAVSNTGTPQNAVFDFVIPSGTKGADGTNGTDGIAATINAGTTTTSAPGTNSNVTNVGTTNAAIFNFQIPKGDQGDPGLSFTGTVPPSNPIEGQLWYNTITGVNYIYYTDSNSSQWVSTSNSYSPAVAGYGASKPNTPAIGQLFYSTTDSKLQLWNGYSWINI